VLNFGGSGPKRDSTDQNQEYLMNWNNKFEIHLPQFSMPSEEKALSLCRAVCKNVCTLLGSMLKSDTRW
jgi:hypothetical protein